MLAPARAAGTSPQAGTLAHGTNIRPGHPGRFRYGNCSIAWFRGDVNPLASATSEFLLDVPSPGGAGAHGGQQDAGTQYHNARPGHGAQPLAEYQQAEYGA